MKKENSKQQDGWIDVHNDEVMQKMGLLRSSLQSVRDESVWRRTPNEKRILRNIKYIGRKRDMHFHSIPHAFIPVRAKLIIQLKKNKTYPKTTYSTECWMSDIPEILMKYQVVNPRTKFAESAVVKYSFDGKTYAPNELPFWK